jgi:hypothetical protein
VERALRGVVERGPDAVGAEDLARVAVGEEVGLDEEVDERREVVGAEREVAAGGVAAERAEEERARGLLGRVAVVLAELVRGARGPRPPRTLARRLIDVVLMLRNSLTKLVTLEFFGRGGASGEPRGPASRQRDPDGGASDRGGPAVVRGLSGPKAHSTPCGRPRSRQWPRKCSSSSTIPTERTGSDRSTRNGPDIPEQAVSG